MNVESIALLVIALMIYFIPAMIGYGKRNFIGIAILNLFLGWTLVGWIASLIWACCDKKS